MHLSTQTKCLVSHSFTISPIYYVKRQCFNVVIHSCILFCYSKKIILTVVVCLMSTILAEDITWRYQYLDIPLNYFSLNRFDSFDNEMSSKRQQNINQVFKHLFLSNFMLKENLPHSYLNIY